MGYCNQHSTGWGERQVSEAGTLKTRALMAFKGAQEFNRIAQDRVREGRIRAVVNNMLHYEGPFKRKGDYYEAGGILFGLDPNDRDGLEYARLVVAERCPICDGYRVSGPIHDLADVGAVLAGEFHWQPHPCESTEDVIRQAKAAVDTLRGAP